jgi:LysM repeat protein
MQDLLKQYKDRLAALEKSIDMQNKNIENLQQAVNTLADAMAPPATSTSASGKIYRVKSGDSLGTIARDNRTTVKAIKDLNNLSKDQIVVGQSLRLPE